jgi:2-beta-glucuronyltransferase
VRVAFISWHYLESRRQAGFHFLARTAHRQGHEVVFCTAPISWLSRLRRDPRFANPVLQQRNRLRRVEDRLDSYVWFTGWHPANLRLGALNRLSAPLFRRYGRSPRPELDPWLAGADTVVFESTPALVAFEPLRRAAPRARLVYRVSDDLASIGCHPIVLEAERTALPEFDLVSVPTRSFPARLAAGGTAYKPHGVDKELYDSLDPVPPRRGYRARCVFVGMNWLDRKFVTVAATALPDVWFDIVGPNTGTWSLPNVQVHGEVSFREAAAIVKAADVGLNPLEHHPGAESLAESLKVQQYTYCGLSYVAPEFLRGGRSNAFYYRPGDAESIRAAVTAAVQRGRTPGPAGPVVGWDDVLHHLLHDRSRA